MQLLCVAGMFYPLHIVNLNVLKAQKRSDICLRLEILKQILVVVLLVITYRWGISAIILGQVMQSLLFYYPNSYYVSKLLNYPVRQQLMDILPYFVTAFLMGICVYILQYISFPGQGVLLIVQIVSGIVLYSAFCRLAKLSAFIQMFEVLSAKVLRFGLTLRSQ